MTLQSDRGQTLERAARRELSTPRARQVVTKVDLPQRQLSEFTDGGGR